AGVRVRISQKAVDDLRATAHLDVEQALWVLPPEDGKDLPHRRESANGQDAASRLLDDWHDEVGAEVWPCAPRAEVAEDRVLDTHEAVIRAADGARDRLVVASLQGFEGKPEGHLRVARPDFSVHRRSQVTNRARKPSTGDV